MRIHRLKMSSDTSGVVKEGLASVHLPPGVFYNPVQEFNRDLTIAVISEYEKIRRKEMAAKARKKTQRSVAPESVESGEAMDTEECVAPEERVCDKSYGDGLCILEGLAASGLRSVRFCKEIPGLRQVYANDFSRDAVETMKKNIELNGVQHLMTASCADAAMLMYESSRKPSASYDVIDLDPYGGPTQFLDGAVQAIKDGGLMCITCTDMAILCGNASEKCFAAYGAMSLKTKCCHELALRIVLRTIDSYANRYGKYIVPLLSVSVDFYCRVFVRVYTGAQKAKESASKSSMLYECTGCNAHHLQPLGRIIKSELPNGQIHKKFTFSQGPSVDRHCDHCNQVHHIAGPLWSAPIHDRDFVGGLIQRVEVDEDLFGTSKRIIGMMTLVSEELPDVPLYYLPDSLCGVIHSTSPGFLTLRSAILHAGYRVSLSHAAINSIKTDAPPSVLWDILRCWTKLHPVNEKRITEGSPCAAILSKEPQLQANFEIHDDAEPQSKKLGLLRFQNSKKDWGPKARGTNDSEAQNEKRKSNQNKRGQKRQKTRVDEVHHKKYHCATYKRTGTCSYGDDCRYNHDIPVDNADTVQQVNSNAKLDTAEQVAADEQVGT